MRNPKAKKSRKGASKPALGGGAAARAYQFALERGQADAANPAVDSQLVRAGKSKVVPKKKSQP
jgi:hypothetical protein